MTKPNPNREVATVAGGCFWCLQPIFQDLRGVEKVEVGYSGGHLANPSYEAVCTDTTGHAEAIQVTFDPQTIPLVDILRIFFSVHDPTTLNRQGGDEGTQYRSAIFTHSTEQEKAAKQVIRAPNAGVRGSSVSRASEPATAPSPSATCSRARSPYSPSSKPSPATTAASRNSIGSDHGDESQKAIATGCMRRSDDGEPSQSAREGDFHLPQGSGAPAGRLVSVGRGGVLACQGARSADPPGHRGHVVPLVPCDRPRVLRGPGPGEGHQRAFRRGQGRPRRAARHRRPVPAGGRRDRGSRRLASHGVPHIRREGLLRRDVLPAEGYPRSAGIPSGAPRDGRILPDESRGHPAGGGCAPPGPRGGPETPRGRRSRERGDAEGKRGLPSRPIRPRQRRHLGTAEVPPSRDDGVGHGPLPPHAGGGPADDRHAHPDLHGPRGRL